MGGPRIYYETLLIHHDIKGLPPIHSEEFCRSIVTKIVRTISSRPLLCRPPEPCRGPAPSPRVGRRLGCANCSPPSILTPNSRRRRSSSFCGSCAPTSKRTMKLVVQEGNNFYDVGHVFVRPTYVIKKSALGETEHDQNHENSEQKSTGADGSGDVLGKKNSYLFRLFSVMLATSTKPCTSSEMVCAFSACLPAGTSVVLMLGVFFIRWGKTKNRALVVLLSARRGRPAAADILLQPGFIIAEDFCVPGLDHVLPVFPYPFGR